MKPEPSVAIVGSTGLVGNEMLVILEDRDFPLSDLKLFASSDSAGEVYKFRDDDIAVEELREGCFEGIDLALFALPNELSEKYVLEALQAGATVIDGSLVTRRNDAVPLVVPEVNGSDVLSKAPKLIANPGSAAIQLSLILNALKEVGEISRVIVSTYQSVSSAGKDALDELWAQTLAVCNQGEVQIEAFPHQIAFNCIPQIDVTLDDGFTREEERLIAETKRLVNLPKLLINATCVRIPVFHSSCQSLLIEFKNSPNLEATRAILNKSKGILLYPQENEYPMPLLVTGSDEIHVGRLRKDSAFENSLNLWIVSDNIRKGAALNAVQIAEGLLLQ